MRRFHEAAVQALPKVTVWGTGLPRREFLHVDDMAAACVHVMELDSKTLSAEVEPMLSHINVGTGEDCSIRDLVFLLAKLTGFNGEIEFDSSKPDGTPRKLMSADRSKRLGWSASIGLEEGLRQTYEWYLDNVANARSS